uniref:RNA-directed DNA polymerase n=1 Tax=Bombyx mori TaxID=7091 RepID=A0A8R2M0S2_BOMMO|nr:uncharacterized protein LOC110385666 isoform X2 [Bombyx mori]
MSHHHESNNCDVSNADVTLFKNNTEVNVPSSEVGSHAASAQQQPEATSQIEPHHGLNTTGNAGSSLEQEQEQPQSALLNAPMSSVPPQFIMQMMHVMQQMSERLSTPAETKIRINDIYLPSFDPDTSVGVREWCQHIDKAIETYRLNDFDIRMKVGSLLKGRAKMWVDDWMVTAASWAELRNNLITTFEPENRYSRDIARFREHMYDSSKDISEFLSRAWVLWRRITKDKLPNEDAVEAVIGCVNDEKLRIELLNTRATTVPELISVASSVRAMKRFHQGSNKLSTNKRPRFLNSTSSNSSCHICKRTNHTTNECYYKMVTESKPEQRNKTTTETTKEVTSYQNDKTTICSFCKIPGHSFETCFKRERALTSNVNYVAGSKLAPIQVKFGSKSFQAIFDSGAECSLMRESVAAQIPGKRLQTADYLKGIGQFPVLSIATLVTVGVIDNINVELQFHIVADYEMTTDILVGMNLINNTNLTMTITSGGTRLARQPHVNQVQCINPIFDKLDCDLTNEEDIAKLRTLLNKYQHLFIRGYPTTRVKTGELEIRLKNPNKYVERRPYRLSPIERERVRAIVKELMEHGIVRESKSPYSSPIILVKKKNGDDRIFFKRSIEYLGNVVSNGQVWPSPRKIDALVKSPVPTTPRQEEAPIQLYTDASSLGFGAVLVQVIAGRQHAVAFMSMRTTETESRYHSYELETLAVVRAIKHFRQYLYGRKFTVITDCNALKASKHKKDLLPRIHRWWAFLQNYNFEVEYRKGQQLQHADYFSRNPVELTVNIMTRDLDWLKIEQRRDETLRAIMDGMNNNNPSNGYMLENNVLKHIVQDPTFGHRYCTVVPRSFQWSLINSFHTALKHPGWEKTLQKIKDSHWFDNMSTKVRKFVDNCVVCRTSKGASGAVQAQMHPIQKPSAAFQVIHMDITGKMGTSNDQHTLAALKRTVHLFGTPVQIIVDGGREFLGEFKTYCDRVGIDIHAIAPGVSRANGQVERVVATLKKCSYYDQELRNRRVAHNDCRTSASNKLHSASCDRRSSTYITHSAKALCSSRAT